MAWAKKIYSLPVVTEVFESRAMPVIGAGLSNDADLAAGAEGAIVTVVNERTNQERSAATNDDGNYVFTGLEPSIRITPQISPT
jgi:hypothetical protein